MLNDDDSASDYSDCDVLPPAAAAYQQAMPRTSVTRAMLTGYKTGGGLYDPKAAEFNQYLLEQQQELGAGAGGDALQAQSGSDDDDYFGLAAGQPGSGLTRSRSCMLGPSTSNNSKNIKYAGHSKGGKGASANEAPGTSGGKQTWEGNPSGPTRNSQMG